MWGKEETVMVWDEPEDRSNLTTINLNKESKKKNTGVVTNYGGDVNYHNHVHTHEHDHVHNHKHGHIHRNDKRREVYDGNGEMMALVILAIITMVALAVFIIIN